MVLFMIPVVTALDYADYNLLYSGGDFDVYGSGEKGNDITWYICPASWSQFNTRWDSPTGDNYNIAVAGEPCARFSTSSAFGVRTNYDDIYQLFVRGYDRATDILSEQVVGTCTTAESDARCNTLSISCVGIFCKIDRGSLCDSYEVADVFVREVGVTGVKAYKINVDIDSASLSNFIVPEINKDYFFELRLHTDVGDYTDDVLAFRQVTIGGCVSPTFRLAVASSKTTADVSIIASGGGILEEYDSYGWTIYKQNYGEYQYYDSGTAFGKDFEITGLIAGKSYKVVVQGVNTCSNGYTHYATFSTAVDSGTIDESWSLDITTNTTYATLEVNPNVTTSYTYQVYDGDGDLVEQNLTSADSIHYKNLVQGVEYLGVATAHFPAGKVTKAGLFTLALDTSNYTLRLVQNDADAFCVLYEYYFTNGTDDVVYYPFPLGSNSMNLSFDSATDDHEYDIGFYGGWNKRSGGYWNLSPSNTYSMNMTIQPDASIQHFSNDTVDFETIAVNVSEPLSFYYHATEESVLDWQNNERADLDMNISIYYENCGRMRPAYSLVYTLWDNSSTAPIRISEPTAVNSYFEIPNLLYGREYFIEAQNVTLANVYGSPTTTVVSANYSLIPSAMEVITCDGVQINIPFIANFSTDVDQLYIMTNDYDNHNDYSGITTVWTVWVSNNENNIISSEKIFTSDWLSQFSHVGEFDDTKEDIHVVVKRDITCTSAGQTVSHEQVYDIDTGVRIEEKYGLFQPLYNIFDDYFPTPFGKFMAIMLPMALFGFIGWMVALSQGIPMSWSVALLPLVVGMIISWFMGIIPTFIMAGVGLIIAVLVIMKIGQSFAG